MMTDLHERIVIGAGPVGRGEAEAEPQRLSDYQSYLRRQMKGDLMNVEHSVPSRRSLRALDLLAFFLADVRDGVGAFLAVYLQAIRAFATRDRQRDGIGADQALN